MGVTREGGQGKKDGLETMVSRVGQRRAPGTLTQDTSSAEASCPFDRSQPRGAPALHRRGRSGRPCLDRLQGRPVFEDKEVFCQQAQKRERQQGEREIQILESFRYHRLPVRPGYFIPKSASFAAGFLIE